MLEPSLAFYAAIFGVDEGGAIAVLAVLRCSAWTAFWLRVQDRQLKLLADEPRGRRKSWPGSRACTTDADDALQSSIARSLPSRFENQHPGRRPRHLPRTPPAPPELPDAVKHTAPGDRHADARGALPEPACAWVTASCARRRRPGGTAYGTELGPAGHGVTIGDDAGDPARWRLPALECPGGKRGRRPRRSGWVADGQLLPGRMKAVQTWPKRAGAGWPDGDAALAAHAHAFESRRDHPRVAGHQDVAGAQQTRQVANLQVLERLARLTSRRASPADWRAAARWLLGQMEIEIGELHEGRGEAHAERPRQAQRGYSSSRAAPSRTSSAPRALARRGASAARVLSLFRRQGRDARLEVGDLLEGGPGGTLRLGGRLGRAAAFVLQGRAGPGDAPQHLPGWATAAFTRAASSVSGARPVLNRSWWPPQAWSAFGLEVAATT